MNQLRYVLLVITVVALVGVSALALTIPNTFVSGEVISAAEMNANFEAVATAVTALESQVAALQAAQPVVAHTKVDGRIDVDTAEMMDVAVVSVDAPGDGYVLVHFTAQAAFMGTTDSNGMIFQIDTVPGGPYINNEHFVVAEGQPANSVVVFVPVAIQRVFAVTAGAHTYRAEASRFMGVAGERWMWNPSITATWYPAGSVELLAGIEVSTAGGGNQP